MPTPLGPQPLAVIVADIATGSRKGRLARNSMRSFPSSSLGDRSPLHQVTVFRLCVPPVKRMSSDRR
jgi:hypothetical protein